MRRYRLDRLEMDAAPPVPATWSSVGARASIRGDEVLVGVVDGNVTRFKAWEFVVRFPRDRDEYVEVRPVRAPALKAWAGIDRVSIQFGRARRGAARGRLYCKVSLPELGAGKRVVRFADRWRELPKWCAPLLRRGTRKKTIQRTGGNDGEHLVFVVRPDDITTMIRIFFATKVWVLKEGFVPE